MKILLCHAYYTQRGGEDCSFEEERDLLVASGHRVIEYVRRNSDMDALGPLAALMTTLWSRRAAADLAELISQESPDVVHCTNTFPLLSPAVCHAAHRHGAAVVQALRNYRLLCAGAYLMRDGRPCEDCVGRLAPWPAIVHRCYRDSAAATAAVAAMQVLHRALGTWRRKVDAFFTLTEFARQKFIDAGFPASRVHVKYNSVSSTLAVGDGSGGYVAFAGRLSPEKGVATLLQAWRQDASLPPLKIAGDGPLASQVCAAAAADSRIQWLGYVAAADVNQMIGAAAALVMPSVWYETFGRTIAEAYAVGTPVLASRLGAMAELVRHDRTGLLFEPGDPCALASAVHRLLERSADRLVVMRREARAAYEERFTPKHNYERLASIYDLAVRRAHRRRAGADAALTAPVDMESKTHNNVPPMELVTTLGALP
jgi:glycosyltransferase involved in cell wall biosynthesis